MKMSEKNIDCFNKGGVGYHEVVEYQGRMFVLSEFNGRDFKVQTGLGLDAELYFLIDSNYRIRLRFPNTFYSDSESEKKIPLLRTQIPDSDSDP